MLTRSACVAEAMRRSDIARYQKLQRTVLFKKSTILLSSTRKVRNLMDLRSRDTYLRRRSN